MREAKLNELVRIGDGGLLAEVLRITGDRATLQVFEETMGVALEEPVTREGLPLAVELGPGLLGSVIDGIGRPLTELAVRSGDFLLPGADAPTIDRTRRFDFTPTVSEGATIGPGDVVGTVVERGGFEHRILVPPDRQGVIAKVFGGPRTVAEPIVERGALEAFRCEEIIQSLR